MPSFLLLLCYRKQVLCLERHTATTPATSIMLLNSKHQVLTTSGRYYMCSCSSGPDWLVTSGTHRCLGLSDGKTDWGLGERREVSEVSDVIFTQAPEEQGSRSGSLKCWVPSWIDLVFAGPLQLWGLDISQRATLTHNGGGQRLLVTCASPGQLFCSFLCSVPRVFWVSFGFMYFYLIFPAPWKMQCHKLLVIPNRDKSESPFTDLFPFVKSLIILNVVIQDYGRLDRLNH